MLLKINQAVRTNDGRIGRILFYTDYQTNPDLPATEPKSAVVLFVNNWSNKYPWSALTAISQDEYDQALQTEKKAVRGILENAVAVASEG